VTYCLRTRALVLARLTDLSERGAAAHCKDHVRVPFLALLVFLAEAGHLMLLDLTGFIVLLQLPDLVPV